MGKQIVRIWSLVNLVLLITAILVPWKVYFSDVMPSPNFLLPGWKLLVNLVYALFDLSFDGGSLLFTLLMILAPAIIIYYIIMNICSFYFNQIYSLSIIFKVIRIFLSLISLTLFYLSGGFNSYMSWGYFIAIAALFSSEIFEFVVYKHFYRILPLDTSHTPS